MVTPGDPRVRTVKRFRRVYYDLFSRWYDRIIAMHSGDASARARDFLVERAGVGAGGRVLDLCTGTGAVALRARRTTGPDGLVVGLDFSTGMIGRARAKAGQSPTSPAASPPVSSAASSPTLPAAEEARPAASPGLGFVVGDASRLPFGDGSFDVVTCSHAMYELGPEVRGGVLAEARRVLRPGGRFVRMEHTEPSHPVTRFLYGVRLAAMGSAKNRDFARDERPFLARHFADVTLELSSTARSKLVRGVKGA